MKQKIVGRIAIVYLTQLTLKRIQVLINKNGCLKSEHTLIRHPFSGSILIIEVSTHSNMNS